MSKNISIHLFTENEQLGCSLLIDNSKIAIKDANLCELQKIEDMLVSTMRMIKQLRYCKQYGCPCQSKVVDKK